MEPDIVIYMDGGCMANPGRLAVAAVACNPEGEIIAESAKDAGEGTNNIAEYRALQYAIGLAKLLGARKPVFVSDSMLIVQQINGFWAIRDHGERARLHGYCTSALMSFDRWHLQHVKREHNKRADWLVSKQLGHARTLKKAPGVDVVSCEHDGRPGWAELV
jgi:ribonuclease HI